MASYRKGSHSVYDIKYHIVWITKYRKDVLRAEIAHRLRDIVRDICKREDIVVIEGHIRKDHVHLLVSVPPHISVSDAVQRIKGKSSWRLLQEFKTLRKEFWGNHLWARGYFAASTGTVNEELIRNYIKNQDIDETNDNFKVS